jgi:hypothetical protein
VVTMRSLRDGHSEELGVQYLFMFMFEVRIGERSV